MEEKVCKVMLTCSQRRLRPRVERSGAPLSPALLCCSTRVIGGSLSGGTAVDSIVACLLGDCIRRLYAWAEKHDSSASDATEDDDEEQETPRTTTTTTTATSTTADHQVVDEEKKRWKRRFAK